MALPSCTAPEPLVETDAAEARLAYRHQRALQNLAAEVPGLEIANDLTSAADRLEMMPDAGSGLRRE
jgi:hypothetical protein